MADIEDRNPLGCQSADDLQQTVSLMGIECGCWFIQQQDRAIALKSACDFKKLPFAQFQGRYFLFQRDRKPNPGEACFCRFCRCAAQIRRQQACCRCVKTVEILKHAEFVEQCKMLIDRDNTRLDGVRYGMKTHPFSVEPEGPSRWSRRTHQNPDQCAFTGTILTHQCMDLAGIEIHIHAGQSQCGSIGLFDLGHLQNSFFNRGALLRHGSDYPQAPTIA